MRRIIPVLLALLLLTACGKTPEPSPAPLPELFADEVTTAPKEAMPPADSESATPAPVPAPAGETVTLDGLISYLRLTLPAGWTCAPGEDTGSSKELLLFAPTNDGLQIKLSWWESFGMCGTGVTFEEIELPNGMTATLATEPSADGFVLWTLILPQSPEQYTLHIYAPQSAIDAHQAEIDAMLASLTIGTLAELPPQPTDAVA